LTFRARKWVLEEKSFPPQRPSFLGFFSTYILPIEFMSGKKIIKNGVQIKHSCYKIYG